MKGEVLREQLARYAHVAWSGWMQYMWSKSRKVEGEVVIPEWAVKRWERQMYTEYDDLTEDEKESDRDEANKMLRLVATAVHADEIAALEDNDGSD